MGLYNFHRVLIIVAILFDVGFSIYCYRKYQVSSESLHVVMLLGSSVVTLVLVTYLIYFNRSLAILRSMASDRIRRCHSCHYDLRGIPEIDHDRCPQCGAELAAIPSVEVMQAK